MNKPIPIGSLLELKIINERIHSGGRFADEIRMEELRSTWAVCTDPATPTVFLNEQRF